MNISITVEAAVKYYGSKTKLAKALNISKQAVSNWGEFVHDNNSYKLYLMTNGKLGNRVDDIDKKKDKYENTNYR